jgi:hypothetical protein
MYIKLQSTTLKRFGFGPGENFLKKFVNFYRMGSDMLNGSNGRP